jgi:hypothetical protein
VDQVRKKGDRDADGSILQEDVSVPINMAYNHHHDMSILGAGSRMEKVPYDPSDPSVPVMMRADPHFVTMAVEHTPSASGLPTNAGLHEGNGGEYRKSFHGFSPGIAYLIDSPERIHVLPMQIDTWNRDEMNMTGSKFVPGPQPKHSLAPQGLDALYSGLLECPLTDKVVKTIVGGAGFNDSHAAQIFQCSANGGAPQHIEGYKKVPLGSWSPHAYGPAASPQPDTEPLNLFWSAKTGDHWLTFGAAQAANATATGYTLLRQIGSAPSAGSKASKQPLYLHYSADRNDHFTSPNPVPPQAPVRYVTMGLQGYLLDSTAESTAVPMAFYYLAACATCGDNVLAQDDGGSTAPQSCTHPVTAAEECFAAANSMDGMANATVQTSQGESDTLASGCTVTYDGTSVITAFFNTKETTQCCGAGVTELVGAAASLVDLKLSVTAANQVTITLAGPSDVWFGVGFFAQTMEEAPYSVIVDGAGAVSERKMANHAAGQLLEPTVTVTSNTVTAGTRTVVLTRPANSSSWLYANFSMTEMTVPFINAIGSTPDLSYHKSKTASTLAMWPAADQSVCMCSQPAAPFGSATGTLKYLPTGEEFGFVNYCLPEPRESVLAQHNPTCDVRSYVGGLQVCKHMWSLLDADQENDPRVQRWKSQPLTYYQKYRIYFQDYNPEVHIGTIPRQGWGIAAAGGLAEYDVPQSPPSTPLSERTWKIWGVLTPGGTDQYLAAIHFHCHAPTCLEMAIYNNVTGELVCSEKPVYGGTGQIDQARFDEPGYILQPPCLWGDAPGLEPMPKASGVPFLIVAITNSTYGHHGEMAFPEVTLVPLVKNSSAYARM